MLVLMAAVLTGAPNAFALNAPDLEGGSVVRVSSRGELRVDDASGRPRWSVGLGGGPSHVLADHRAVYAVNNRFLRAFAGGVARWDLDLGAAPREVGWQAGYLALRLPGGTAFVNVRQGAFCTPRQPCPGLPSWRLGQVGVPFLDLPGLGVPGLGLVLNPALLDEGDALGALVSPGPTPGLTRPPVPALAPKVRSVEVGSIELGTGASGKVRSFSIGGAQPSPRLSRPHAPKP